MRKKNILIIDEDPSIIDPVIRRIEYDFDDISVKHCLVGNEGMNEILSNKYEIVILDMMLPLDEGVSTEKLLAENIDETLYGIFILKKVREQLPLLPILCYTVFNDIVVIEQIKSNNAKYYCKISTTGFDELFEEINQLCKE